MTFESRVRGERVRKFPHGKTPKKERRKQNKKNRLREKERTTRLDKVRQEALKKVAEWSKDLTC